MAENKTQMSTVFDLQRSTIEQNQRAINQLIDAQRTASKAAVDGLEGYKRIQEQTTELTEEMIHAYLDAVEEAPFDVDCNRLHELIDENFDQLQDAQDDGWEIVLEVAENNYESVDEALDTYNEFVDSSFDSFLDAHEGVEKDLEGAESIEIGSN